MTSSPSSTTLPLSPRFDPKRPTHGRNKPRSGRLHSLFSTFISQPSLPLLTTVSPLRLTIFLLLRFPLDFFLSFRRAPHRCLAVAMAVMIREASNTAADEHVPTAMAKRKAGGDGDMLDTNTPLRLTRKNLARLNALNGDAEDSDNDNDSAYLFEDDSDDTMKKTSTTDSGFEQRAYENGILNPTASYPPPQGLDTIRHYLTRRRTSTQPSEHTHQRYCKKVSTSDNEDKVSFLIQTDIMKRYDYSDPQYDRIHGRAITRIPPQDFNDGFSDPLPDILEGLSTAILPDHLRNYALHTKNSLSFSHFAAEFKRTDSNLHQAIYHAAYDGAVLVNARDRALAQAATSGCTRDTLEQAAVEIAVFTCVTDGKVAEVFSHHVQGGQYHQNLIARESLFSYPNRGRELIRNTQDYARSKSYELAALLGADLDGQEVEEQN